MLNGGNETSWAEATVVLAGLLAVGFLVSWVGTEVVRLSRRAYIAVLALVTLGATAAVAAVAGTSIPEMVAHRWGLGLAGALVTGAATGFGIRKQEPGTQHLARHDLGVAAAWEGVVYGLAEGVLLSVVPVFVVWQAAADAGWNDAAAWAVGLVASAAMIAIHHFGYWDYRGPQVAIVVAGCGLLTLGYLATGSVLAPALGHVLMHLSGITGGVQLPPHVRPPLVGASAGPA